MLEKAINIVAEIKSDAERRKDEKEQLKKEQQERAEHLELEQKSMEEQKEAERIAVEKAKLQAEKDLLINMSEKELLVEAVIALRGIYTRLYELEQMYEDIDSSISSIDKEFKSARIDGIRKDLELNSMRLQNR